MLCLFSVQNIQKYTQNNSLFYQDTFTIAGLTLTVIATFMRWRQYRIKRREKLDRERNAYHSSYFGQQQKDSIGSSPSSSKIKIRPWYRIPNMSIVPWITVSIGVFFVIFLSPALANYSLFEIPLALSLSLTSITPLSD